MTARPQDMGPGDLAPNTAPPETHTADQARHVHNNQYYNSLPPGAKEQFLAALEDAARAGLSEEAAWSQAVRAVEYSGMEAEGVDAPESVEDNL